MLRGTICRLRSRHFSVLSYLEKCLCLLLNPNLSLKRWGSFWSKILAPPGSSAEPPANSQIRTFSVVGARAVSGYANTPALGTQQRSCSEAGRRRGRAGCVLVCRYASSLGLAARQNTPAIDGAFYRPNGTSYQLQPSFHTQSTEPEPTARARRAGEEFY